MTTNMSGLQTFLVIYPTTNLIRLKITRFSHSPNIVYLFVHKFYLHITKLIFKFKLWAREIKNKSGTSILLFYLLII